MGTLDDRDADGFERRDYSGHMGGIIALEQRSQGHLKAGLLLVMGTPSRLAAFPLILCMLRKSKVAPT